MTSNSSTTTPTRRSSRPRTPVRRFLPSESVQSSPNRIVARPSKKKPKQPPRTPKISPKSVSSPLLKRVNLDLWKELQKEKFKANGVLGKLMNSYADNKLSIVSLSLNLIMRSSGFQSNVMGSVKNGDVLSVVEVLEDRCEEDLETKESDLNHYLFSVKRKSSHVQKNYRQYWKQLPLIIQGVFTEEAVSKALLTSFDSLLNFGINSIRHCTAIAVMEVALQLLEQVKQKRKECLVEVDERKLKSLLTKKGFIQEDEWNEMPELTVLEELKSLEKFVKNVMYKFVSKRSKDVSQYVRLEVFEFMDKVIKENHEYFEEDVYLKYLGWGLNDRYSKIRYLAVGTLNQLYSKNIYQDLIIARYKVRLLEMCNDVDFNVSIQVLAFIGSITENSQKNSGSVSLFSSDEVYFLDSQLFIHFSDNYQHSEKQLVNRNAYLKYRQTILASFIARFVNLQSLKTKKEALKVLRALIKACVFQLGSSTLTERQKYLDLLQMERIEVEEPGKKLQLLALPFAFEFVSALLVDLFLLVSKKEKSNPSLKALIDFNVLQKLNESDKLNEQERLVLFLFLRAYLTRTRTQDFKILQTPLLSSSTEVTELEYSLTRRNKAYLSEICSNAEVDIYSLLNRHSDSNIYLAQLLHILQLQDTELSTEMAELLCSLLTQHSDESLVMQILKIIQSKRSVEAENTLIELVEEIVAFIEATLPRFEQTELSEEVEISLSVNLFKLLAIYQMLPSLVKSLPFEGVKGVADSIILKESREKLSQLSEEEFDKKQTLISCRGLYLKYFVKLWLLMLIRRVIKLDIKASDNSFNETKEKALELQLFINNILELEDTGALMEAEFQDSVLPFLAELYSVFSLPFLAKTLISEELLQKSDDNEKEDFVLKLTTLALEVAPASERALLNLVQIRVKELHDDLKEIEANSSPDEENVELRNTMQRELRRSLNKDLRVCFTVNTLFVPVLSKLVSSDFTTELNIKTAAFMLQYFHQQPEFIEESVEVLLEQLHKNSFSQEHVSEICYMAVKYVYSLYKRNRTDDNDAELSSNAIGFVEKLTELVLSLEKEVFTIDSTIVQMFVKCADYVLLSFPENLLFFKFFKYYLVPIKSGLTSKKRRTKAVNLLKLLRETWVKMVSNLSAEVQNELYGESQDALDLTEAHAFEDLLGVRISLPGKSKRRRSQRQVKEKEKLSPTPPAESKVEEEEEEEEKNIFSESDEETGIKRKGPMLRRHEKETEEAKEEMDLFEEEKEEEEEEEEEITGFAPRNRRRRRR